MSFADDVDVVREYVRTTGRSDYLRMYETGPECIAVEFAFNVERHAAALAAAVGAPKHIQVMPGRKRPDQLSELSRQYWEPLQDSVSAVWDTLPSVHEVSFGYDEDGPILGIGIWPFTEEECAHVAAAFEPHRVRIHHQGPVTQA